MIYCECKPDEVLIEVLINKKPKHGDNKSEICKRLENEKNIIALLDKDPNSYQPLYLNRLQRIFNSEELGLEILYDRERNNKIILLNPRLEDWVLRIAKLKNITLGKLPRKPSKLKKEINQKLEHFRKLLQAIKKKKPKEFIVLARELQMVKSEFLQADQS